MSKPILLALASVIVLAAAGCSGGDSGAGGGGAALKGPVTPEPASHKAGSPGKAGTATVSINPAADPDRFAPGTKGGSNNVDKSGN